MVLVVNFNNEPFHYWRYLQHSIQHNKLRYVLQRRIDALHMTTILTSLSNFFKSWILFFCNNSTRKKGLMKFPMDMWVHSSPIWWPTVQKNYLPQKKKAETNCFAGADHRNPCVAANDVPDIHNRNNSCSNSNKIKLLFDTMHTTVSFSFPLFVFVVLSADQSTLFETLLPTVPLILTSFGLKIHVTIGTLHSEKMTLPRV